MPSCHLSACEIDALYAPGVGSAAVQLYVLLRSYRNAATGEAFPSRRTIGERIGMSERAVTYRLRALEALALVVTIRTTGRPNRYTFPLATPASDCSTTPATDCSGTSDRPLQLGDTDPCNGLQPNKDLLTDKQREQVQEAARRLSHWSGRTITPAKLETLAHNVLPSEFQRGVDSLLARDASEVRSPVSVLKLAIADERGRRDEF